MRLGPHGTSLKAVVPPIIKTQGTRGHPICGSKLDALYSKTLHCTVCSLSLHCIDKALLGQLVIRLGGRSAFGHPRRSP